MSLENDHLPKRFASFDGDADRLIYYFVDDDNTLCVQDGDKTIVKIYIIIYKPCRYKSVLALFPSFTSSLAFFLHALPHNYIYSPPRPPIFSFYKKALVAGFLQRLLTSADMDQAFTVLRVYCCVVLRMCVCLFVFHVRVCFLF